MLWPLNMPFVITACALAGMVILFTVYAPSLRWNRGIAFFASTIFAFVLFIPTLIGVMEILDEFRFGIFQYDTYDEVNDFRVERYLPPEARDITLEKTSHGHRAKYRISESDLKEFLDELWREHGKDSPEPREKLEKEVVYEGPDRAFGDLGWPSLNNPILYSSPRRSNFAGTVYYYDRNAGTVYHEAGYW